MGKKAKKKARTPTKEKRVATRSPKDLPLEGSDPAEETVGIEVSLPNEKRSCSHLGKGFDLSALSEKIGSSEAIRCEDCREGAADRRGNKGKGKHGKKKGGASVEMKLDSRAIWICLECGHYGCGGIGFPTVPQSHAVRHARLMRHQLAIQLENTNLRWCFPCGGPISAEKIEESNDCKDLFGEVVKLIKGRSTKSSKDDVEDVWFGGGSVMSETNIKADTSVSGSLDKMSGGYVVRGLVNLGNTCFFNSVMQNLLAINRLRDHLLACDSSSVGPLTTSLKKLFLEIEGDAGKRNVINPKSLFGSICSKAPQFRGYQQQDSHELLRCLLDILSTEEIDMRKKGENSLKCSKTLTFVDSVFGGQISSTVCCMECGYASTVYEPFLDLSLPVPTKKPTPKKSQPVSRGKKAKVLPKRGVKPRPKVREGSWSASINNPQSPVEGPEASVSSSMDASRGQNSALVDGQQDNNDVVTNAEGQLAEVSANKAATEEEDSFAWLDYLEPSEPLSAEISSASQNNNTMGDGSSQMGENSARVESGDNFCVGTVSDDIATSLLKSDSVENHDHSAEDNLKNQTHSINSLQEEPLPMFQDSEVLLLPYKEDDTQAPVERPADSSLVATGSGQDESAEFDGFGDLFAEPEITSGPTVESSLTNNSSTSLVAGNCSESDPDEVDDSATPVSVESCLIHFTKPELLTKDNAWHCEKCSKALQLQKMNQTNNKKAFNMIRENGSEEKSGISQVVADGISCNGNVETDLSCSRELDHSRNNSTKHVSSERIKGEVEGEITKPESEASSSSQLDNSSGVNGKENDAGDDESEAVEDTETERAVPIVKVKRDATKRVQIFKAPPVLTVHLKRFSQDARGRLSKLSGHVIFREMIDLAPYVDSREKGERFVYRLVGVVEHLGTMRGGHYVAYIRGRGSVWYHASDAYVREVSLEEVLRCDAYILFYETVSV